MNRLHSIVYPITYIGFNVMKRLSPIFQRLIVLIPAEDCICTNQILKPEEALLSSVAPCPLGERLPWFNGFIESTIGWARDIGLGNGFGLQTNDFLKDDESIPAIIDALAKEKNKNPLIEAQIFLRLAHDLDQKEDETELALEMLKTKEASLKDILNGPTHPADEPESPIHEPNKTTWTVSTPLKRLTSWSELWIRTDADIRTALPIGISIDIKDLMDTAYESLTNESAVDLLALKLPHDPSDFNKKWPAIKKEFEDLTYAVSIFKRENEKTQDKKAKAALQRLKEAALRISDRWNDSLTNELTYGPTLGLGLYPKASFGELLLRASGRHLPASQDKNTYTAQSEVAGSSFYLY